MATEIPAHNLREVAAAAVNLIKDPTFSEDDLLALIPGPDYPGGAQIISSPEEIAATYRSGRGSLRVRTGPLDDRPITSEATIDADEWAGPEALTRVITGNYLVGRSTIRVRCRDELSASQLQEIHEAVRGLTGLTIVTDDLESYGTYYVYFDDMRAVTDLFGESKRDADDMSDGW